MAQNMVINEDTLNLLHMIYNNIEVSKLNNAEHIEVYKCSIKEENEEKYAWREGAKGKLIILYDTINNVGVQYDDMTTVDTVQDLILIEGVKDDRTLLMDLVLVDINTLSEVCRYESISFCERLSANLMFIHGRGKSYLYSISERKVTIEAYKADNLSKNIISIGCEDGIIIYDVVKEEIINKYDCKCCATLFGGGNGVGKYYRFLNYGYSVLVLDIETSEVLRLITSENVVSINTLKNSYCDTIITAGKDSSDYLYDGNYFVCNSKIMQTKEYLEHLTIKEVEPVINNKTGEIKHYKVVNSKGLTGILSKDFRKLSINGVLNGENILDSRLDFIKERYLT